MKFYLSLLALIGFCLWIKFVVIPGEIVRALCGRGKDNAGKESPNPKRD